MLKLRKQGKTIVLSTHFMDEADILGDKIGILAYGSLQCFGTPEFLKQRFGLGYSLNVVMGAVPSSSSFKSSADVEDPRVTKLIQSTT
jgi:ATP-binding cassette subfamily A (ABC1) protein 3